MFDIAEASLMFLALLSGVGLIAFGLVPLMRGRSQNGPATYRFSANDLILLPVLFAEFVTVLSLLGVPIAQTGEIQVLALVAICFLAWAWGIRLLAPFHVESLRRRALFMVFVFPALLTGGVGLFSLLVLGNYQLNARSWTIGLLLFVAAEGLRRVNEWLIREARRQEHELRPVSAEVESTIQKPE